DKLAYLGSLKEYIKDFNFSLTNREKIDFYFEKQNKKDDSKNATDSYLLEFTRILQLLEENNDKNKLLIETRNKNIYLILSENRIEKWLKNNWCHHGSIVKLKAPKEICIRIKNLIDGRTNETEFKALWGYNNKDNKLLRDHSVFCAFAMMIRVIKMSKLCNFEQDDQDYKKQNFNTWWQDDFQSNFHRPIMYPNNEGHIVEYLQVKVLRITKKGKNENFKENQNFLVNKESKKIIRSHKWYKKEANIIDENDQNFVNHMFPDIKIDKIKFKNNY
ncbi:4611_t:CDS:2, partial [Scutellospora calospora]